MEIKLTYYTKIKRKINKKEELIRETLPSNEQYQLGSYELERLSSKIERS